MVEEAELHRRLVTESWLLRDVDALMERGPVVTRCKLCEERVTDEVAHWRGHVRARESLRRRSEKQVYDARVRALEKARAARGK